MLSIRLDPTSSLSVRWPESYRAIVALGEAYVAYEGSLPAEAQLKDIPVTAVQTALTEAKAAIAAARSGEQGRASAGELVQQTYAALQPLIDKAYLQLKLNHFDHLSQLEEWGLDTVMDQNGVRVRKPATQRQKLQRQDQPHDAALQRIADAAAMRQDQVALKRRHIAPVDADRGELAEAGVDAIDRLIPGDDAGDAVGGAGNPGMGRGVEGNGGAVPVDVLKIGERGLAGGQGAGHVRRSVL